jgi:hypothetical protein
MEQPSGDRNDLIFVGVVAAIGPPPREWGGQQGAFQEVVYRVERTIAGVIPDPLVSIRHAVVRESPLAQPGDAPGLSARLFTPGSRLVVMAVREAPGTWLAPSEHFGAMPHSEKLEQHLRAATQAFEPTSDTVDFGRTPLPTKR